MPNTFKTPGVYIQELSAFPNSLVPVPTAVPAFIGYTEKAEWDKLPLLLKPIRVSSFGEFLQYFGGAPKTVFDISGNHKNFELAMAPATRFLLYYSIKFFFVNGGSDCYIISVGGYDYENGVKKSTLGKGFEPLEKELEPTILVIPDAVLISDQVERSNLTQKSLQHCGEQQNRIAILDVANGVNDDFENDIKNFRTSVGSNYLQYGAAYFPWLHTTVTPSNEIDFTHIKKGLFEILNKSVESDLAKENLDKNKAEELKKSIEKTKVERKDDGETKKLHQTLLAQIPLYKNIMDRIQEAINLLPPSGAMAGIYAMVDNTDGVWKAPANVSVSSVISPAVSISNDAQEDLNTPIDGKTVNAIRTFPGQGVLVWGARTLDGNSQDWRYINVRRTVIFIEQSIKYAIEAYVFASNTANTWNDIKAMVSNFLTNVWKQGGLAGASPSDAFTVDIGLGVTMTNTDILDGYMRMSVKVAISRPAEFIVLTFEQKMAAA